MINIENNKRNFFNISQRSNIRNMEVKKMTNGFMIYGKKANDVIINDNNALIATINLGKYIFNHNLDKTLEKYNNFDTLLFEYQARDLKGSKPKLSLNALIKIYSDEKLLVLLEDWINFCGISNYYFNGTNLELFPDNVIAILKFCKDLYNDYYKISSGEKVSVSIRINYTYMINDNNTKIDKTFETLHDLFYYNLINYSFSKSRHRYMKECTYCGDLFIGTKKSLTCSNICKERKYLLNRKGKENDTDNQQK